MMEGGLVVRGRIGGRQQRGSRVEVGMSSSRAQRRACAPPGRGNP